MDFPIGKKLFHLIVNPGSPPSPLHSYTKMAAELVIAGLVQSTNNV